MSQQLEQAISTTKTATTWVKVAIFMSVVCVFMTLVNLKWAGDRAYASSAIPEDGIARVVSNGRVLLAGHTHGDSGFYGECPGCLEKLSVLIAQKVDNFGPAIERYVNVRVQAEVAAALQARAQGAAVAPVTTDVKEK